MYTQSVRHTDTHPLESICMSFFMAYKFHVFVTVYYYFYGLSPRQEVITTTENEYSNVFHHGNVGLRTVNIRNSSFFLNINS